MTDYIQGMCCDCKHSKNIAKGICCDYSEQENCKLKKEDGSCWEAFGKNDVEKAIEAIEMSFENPLAEHLAFPAYAVIEPALETALEALIEKWQRDKFLQKHNSEPLLASYDMEFDTLYLSSIYKEEYGIDKENGITEFRDMETGEVTGYMIEDFIVLVKRLSEGGIE